MCSAHLYHCLWLLVHIILSIFLCVNSIKSSTSYGSSESNPNVRHCDRSTAFMSSRTGLSVGGKWGGCIWKAFARLSKFPAEEKSSLPWLKCAGFSCVVVVFENISLSQVIRSVWPFRLCWCSSYTKTRVHQPNLCQSFVMSSRSFALIHTAACNLQCSAHCTTHPYPVVVSDETGRGIPQTFAKRNARPFLQRTDWSRQGVWSEGSESVPCTSSPSCLPGQEYIEQGSKSRTKQRQQIPVWCPNQIRNHFARHWCKWLCIIICL